MRIKTLANWYGSARLVAEHVGRLLGDRTHVTVPFAGGMAELPHVRARTVVVSDLHRHVINLARAVAAPAARAEVVRRVDAALFHPRELQDAQALCVARETAGALPVGDPEWAAAYFVTSWMTRAGSAGTDAEFTAGLSVRWTASGGDSVVRFRSAVAGLDEWGPITARCTFLCEDAFVLLPQVKDQDGCGVYSDCPFVDAGDKYTYSFTEDHQRRLATELSRFEKARVVVRFHDHPLIRELYPPTRWKWDYFTGRAQTNAFRPEVLLTRN